MSYGTEHIIKVLKEARTAKGLSQRALSARTGVPQSHISKIENGTIDIRLSSLIELARALDLDLKLVPRKAVPAVDSIVRSATSTPAIPNPTALRELNRLSNTVEAVRTIYPDLSAIRQLHQSVAALKAFQINEGTLNAIRKSMEPIERIKKQSAQIQKTADAIKTLPLPQLSEEELKAINRASRALQNLRNNLAHIPELSLPRPAYRLEHDAEVDDG